MLFVKPCLWQRSIICAVEDQAWGRQWCSVGQASSRHGKSEERCALLSSCYSAVSPSDIRTWLDSPAEGGHPGPRESGLRPCGAPYQALIRQLSCKSPVIPPQIQSLPKSKFRTNSRPCSPRKSRIRGILPRIFHSRANRRKSRRSVASSRFTDATDNGRLKRDTNFLSVVACRRR